MLPHKVIDNFIKEYNLIFKLRGYSKMNVAQKNKLMEAKVKAVHDSTIKTEWTRLNKEHDKKMRKTDRDTRAKPAAAPKSKSLPASKIPKKKNKNPFDQEEGNGDARGRRSQLVHAEIRGVEFYHSMS